MEPTRRQVPHDLGNPKPLNTLNPKTPRWSPPGGRSRMTSTRCALLRPAAGPMAKPGSTAGMRQLALVPAAAKQASGEGARVRRPGGGWCGERGAGHGEMQTSRTSARRAAHRSQRTAARSRGGVALGNGRQAPFTTKTPAPPLPPPAPLHWWRWGSVASGQAASLNSRPRTSSILFPKPPAPPRPAAPRTDAHAAVVPRHNAGVAVRHLHGVRWGGGGAVGAVR